jgi:hypothetical protein
MRLAAPKLGRVSGPSWRRSPPSTARRWCSPSPMTTRLVSSKLAPIYAAGFVRLFGLCRSGMLPGRTQVEPGFQIGECEQPSEARGGIYEYQPCAPFRAPVMSVDETS